MISNAKCLHIYVVWFSPRGLGVKVAMLYDNPDSMYHQELSRYVKEQFYSDIPQFDDECGNLSVHFLCSTPEFYINLQRGYLASYHFEHDSSMRAVLMGSYNHGNIIGKNN